MSIIEKLKISKAPWRVDYISGKLENEVLYYHAILDADEDTWNCVASTWLTPNEANALVIAAAPEMLEALIDTTSKLYFDAYCALSNNGWNSENCKIKAREEVKKYIEVIEKATGKTWEEIKELINN